jgi:hypothetical protein
MVFGRAGPLHDVFENLKDAERHPHNPQGSFSDRLLLMVAHYLVSA